jgi:quercetin dioxygenase-like cupin family protein
MWTDDNLMYLRPEDQEEHNGMVSLMSASDSVGGWGAVLIRAGKGTSGRTHIHRGESEAFFIVYGEVDLCGSQSITPLGPGSFALVPPDTAHGLRVLSDEARWLAIWPSALDGLIDELNQARAEGRDDLATFDEIRSRHGIDPGGPIPERASS